MKINKHIFLMIILAMALNTGWCQEIGVLNEEELLQPEVPVASDGVNLVQFGDQNTADIIQLQNFSTQLSLYQQGSLNSAKLFQYGSGRFNVIQNGVSNDISSIVTGYNMDVEITQLGQFNQVRQWSVGDNVTYKFEQLGIQNSIEHLNFGGNSTNLFVQQRGSDMQITIYTH